MPVNCSPSTMNRLCWYIESEFNGYVTQLKNQNFDYSFLKSDKVIRYPKAKKEEMPHLRYTGISSAVFSVFSEVYNNSQAVCFSSNHFPPIQNLFYDFKRAVPKDCSLFCIVIPKMPPLTF